MGSVVHIALQDVASNVHQRVDMAVDQDALMGVLETVEITVPDHARHV